ncbi:MAG: AsmA-like C-terminal domain-containing protein [Alphaproteobacteria bacterium]|nr:AsmA-like C-terminal domain-containing protein [Alphaproteobacteria bacterium]
MTQKTHVRVAKVLLKGLFLLSAAFFVMVAAFMLRLYHEPLDLTFSQSHIEKALKPVLGDVSFSFVKPVLIWQGIGHPLEVQTQHLKITDKESQRVLADIPVLRFTCRFRSLLKAELIPSRLSLVKPILSFVLPTQDKPDTTQDDARLKRFITDTFLTSESATKALKDIQISDAHLALIQDGKTWVLPKVSVTFARKRGHLEGHADVMLVSGQRVGAAMIYDPEKGSWQAETDLESLSLMSFLEDLCCFVGVGEDLLQTLKGSDMTLTGKGALRWHPKKGLQELSLATAVPAGVLSLPRQWLPAPLHHKGIQLNLLLKDRKLILEKTFVTLPEGVLSLTGTGEMPSPQTPKSSFVLHAALADFPIKALGQMWSKDFAEAAQSWVVAHIPSGHVPHATANVTLCLTYQVDQTTPAFSFEGIDGVIDLEKASLAYLPTMPEIKGITARARYDQDHFDIAVQKAESHGLALSEGRVLIEGLTKELQTLSLKVRAKGPLMRALEIINRKPLEALKDLPVSLKEGSGQVDTFFELSFPLKDPLEAKDFTYAVDGSASNVSFKNLLTKLPVNVEKAQQKVLLKDQYLTIKGSALVNGDPTDIHIQNELTVGGRRPTLVTLKGKTTPKGLERLGVDLTHYVSGVLPYTLVITPGAKSRTGLHLKMDLALASLSYGAWHKENHQPASFEAKAALLGSRLEEISLLHARAKDLDLDASIHFSPKTGDLAKGMLKRLHLGKTDIAGTIEPGKYKDYMIRLHGKALDAGPYIETMKDAKKTDVTLGKTFDLRVSLHELYLSEAQTLYENTLSLGYERERVHTMAFKGHFDPAAKKFFFADMIPRAQEGRKFRLRCENGGALLKSFDFTKKISQGHLKVLAYQTGPKKTDVWEGKVELDDFWVKDAPLLGRLLSLAFPTGFVNAFSGKGLNFERLKMDFKLNAHRLVIPKGKAYGPSFGFSLHGSIEKDFHELNLAGTIYPAYFVNMAISKIPLIGQLITGGKGEGLWGVSYTITGPTDNVRIAVNPLTAFTPGILRKLFMPETNEDMDFDEPEVDENKVLE